MPNIVTNIRWASNTDELRKNLLQGIDTIDAMKSAVDRTVRSLGGEGLFAAANKTAAAIVQLGGVTKLTAAEQERANALLEKAIAKYEQMGQTVPTALRQIADATRKANDETSGWLPLLQELGSSWVARVAEGILLRDAIHKLLDVMVEGLELFPEMVQHTIELGSQLLTMSLKTGISVESLSKLRYVAQQTGTDLPSLTTAIFKMQASLGAVGDESKKTQDALAKLHLNLADLKNSKPDEAFTTILDKMRELPTVADRAGVGMALFGKGWREVSQLAVEDIKGLMHEAEELGIVMTTETAAAAKAAEDGMAALKAQIEALTVRIGAAFLPAVIGISHDLSEMFKVAVDESNKSLDEMGKNDGFLATVSRAMGTGSGAIAAQTELYYVLRDAVIALVRNGLEPAITAIGFVGQEFNAAKVVVGDVTQAFALLELGATKLAKFKLQSSDVLGIDPNTQKSIKEAQQHIDELNASIAARGASLKAAKSAETDWANSAANANATIESALKKIEASHLDVAAVIKSVSDMSRAAAQNSGTAMDEMTSKERSELEKLQEALKAVAAVYNVDYTKAIDQVGRATYETIVALKENGISVEELARAYRLSKADVELLVKAHEAEVRTLDIVRGIEKTALAESLKEYEKWAAGVSKSADDVGKHIVDGAVEINQASKELADLIAQQSLSSTDYQIQKIDEWAAAAKGAFKGTAEQAKVYYDLIDQLAGRKTAAQYIDFGAMEKGSTASLQAIADKAATTYLAMKADSGSYSAAAIEHQRQVFMAAQDAADGTLHAWRGAFIAIGQAIPALVQQAFTGGGGLAGAGRAAGSLVGSELGKGLVSHLTETAPEFMGSALGKVFGAAIPAIGALAGPLISAIIGLFDHIPDDLHQAAQHYGVSIGDDVLQGIRKDMDSLHLSEQAATIFNADKLFPTVTVQNFSQALRVTHDAFSMIATGQLTVAQGGQVLEAMWPKLAQIGTDAYGRIDDQLKDLIKQNAIFGTQSKAIADFLKGQGSDAVGGFVDVVAGVLTSDKLKVWDDLKAKVDAAVASGHGLDDALAAQKDGADLAKSGLADLGTQAIATYTAMVASGSSEADALKAIHPALDTLQKAYADLGLNVDDVGLKALLMRDKIVTAAPQLITGIGGITKSMVALDNMGLMTPKTFEAMERSGQTMYDQLIAKVHELGGTDADALSEMQGYLHVAADEAKKLGIPLDDNTQKLIDQSKAAGIWQDAMTPEDKLISAMDTLAKKVQNLVNALLGIPQEVDTTVTTHYQTDGTPYPTEIGGGIPRYPDLPDGIETVGRPPAFASEAYVRAPTLATIGDVLGGEFVLRPSTLNSWLGHAAVMGSAAAASPTMPISVSSPTTTQGVDTRQSLQMNMTLVVGDRAMGSATRTIILPAIKDRLRQSGDDRRDMKVLLEIK